MFIALVSLGFLTVNPSSDFRDHLEYARDFGAIGVDSPHFLYQLVVHLALKVVPFIGLDPIGVAVVGACYGLMGVALYHFTSLGTGGRLQGFAFFACFAPLVSAHIFAVTLFEPNFYYNYLVPLTYHNPTQHLNKLLAVVIWFYFMSLVFLDEKALLCRWHSLVLLSVFCVLSALSKPSFLIAFLPICAVFGVIALIDRRWRRFAAFTAVLIPVIATMVWQMLFHYDEANPDRVGVAFLPFAVLPDYTQILLCLPLSMALPLTVTFLGIGSAEDRRALFWTWGFVAVAMFYTFFMAEVPEEWTGDGNFFWTGQTGVFLILVQSAWVLARSWTGWTTKGTVAAGVLAAHFVFGLILAGAAAFVPAGLWL